MMIREIFPPQIFSFTENEVIYFDWVVSTANEYEISGLAPSKSPQYSKTLTTFKMPLYKA